MYNVPPAIAALDVIFAPNERVQRILCVRRSSAYRRPFHAPK
jgi:hypothetical protein